LADWLMLEIKKNKTEMKQFYFSQNKTLKQPLNVSRPFLRFVLAEIKLFYFCFISVVQTA